MFADRASIRDAAQILSEAIDPLKRLAKDAQQLKHDLAVRIGALERLTETSSGATQAKEIAQRVSLLAATEETARMSVETVNQLAESTEAALSTATSNADTIDRSLIRLAADGSLADRNELSVAFDSHTAGQLEKLTDAILKQRSALAAAWKSVALRVLGVDSVATRNIRSLVVKGHKNGLFHEVDRKVRTLTKHEQRFDELLGRSYQRVMAKIDGIVHAAGKAHQVLPLGIALFSGAMETIPHDRWREPELAPDAVLFKFPPTAFLPPTITRTIAKEANTRPSLWCTDGARLLLDLPPELLNSEHSLPEHFAIALGTVFALERLFHRASAKWCTPMGQRELKPFNDRVRDSVCQFSSKRAHPDVQGGSKVEELSGGTLCISSLLRSAQRRPFVHHSAHRWNRWMTALSTGRTAHTSAAASRIVERHERSQP